MDYSRGKKLQTDRATGGEGLGVKTRALIAARELLSERGHDRLNLRMIATRAKSGLASIYYHFESKDALFLQLAIDGYHVLCGSMLEARQSSDDIFRSVSTAYLGFAQDNTDLYRLMYDERMLAAHEDLRKCERNTLGLFEESVALDGRFPSEHSANIASTLYAFGRGLSSLGSSYPERKLPEEEWQKIRSGLEYVLGRSVERIPQES